MITLRPGNPDDFDHILAWRNAPAAVQYSKRGRQVTHEEEYPKYAAALKGTDPVCKVMIACIPPETPIGYVRFDLQPSGLEAEVNIALDPAQHGKGHGTEILKQGCAYAFDHYGIKRLTAIIMRENIASVKVFTKAGFTYVTDDGTFATYELRKQ